MVAGKVGGIPALGWLLNQRVAALDGVLSPAGQSVLAEVFFWALFYFVYSQVSYVARRRLWGRRLQAFVLLSPSA
jgi:hypothetical protein